MVHYGSRIIVPFPRQRVWQLLSDWTNLAKWDMNITRCEVVGSKNGGVGAKYSCTFNFKGNVSNADYECVEWEEGKKAVFCATTAMVRTRDTIALADVDDGKSTEVYAEFSMHLRGPLYLFSFLLNGPMQSTCPQVIKDLDAFVRQELEK